jgi:hypothetical protein
VQKTISDSRAEIDFEPAQQINYVAVKIKEKGEQSTGERVVIECEAVTGIMPAGRNLPPPLDIWEKIKLKKERNVSTKR